MRICFTQDEVEAIVLAHVQKIAPEMNTVFISSYRSDWCVVTREEPEPAVEPKSEEK